MKIEYSEIEFDEDDLPPEPKNEMNLKKLEKKIISLLLIYF